MSTEQRKLTDAEKRRLELFNQKSEQLSNEGYLKKELTCDPFKANLIGPLYGLILSIPFIIFFFIFKPKGHFEIDGSFFIKYLIFFGLMLLFIVIHELLHGFTWSRFTPNGFKDIEFGIIWKSLNPYCTCKETLKRNEYLLGLMMPCIILGFLPCIISWFNHDGWFLAMGVIMILSAGGDLLIGKLIIVNKTNNESYYLDHPTEIGLVRFEKKR